MLSVGTILDRWCGVVTGKENGAVALCSLRSLRYRRRVGAVGLFEYPPESAVSRRGGREGDVFGGRDQVDLIGQNRGYGSCGDIGCDETLPFTLK